MDESHKILMSESIPPWNVNCSVFGLLANSQWAPITNPGILNQFRLGK